MATGSSDREIKISVVVDANGAVKALTQLGEKTEEFKAKAEDGGKSSGLFDKAIAAAGTTAGTVGLAIGALGGAFYALNKIIGRGDAFNDVSSAFDELNKKAGALSGDTLQSLRIASQGTIDDLELMKLANKALTAGLDPTVFDEVVQAAKKYADATGTDATEAISKFTTTITKGSEEQLKQLGIFKNGRIELDAVTASTLAQSQAQLGSNDALEVVSASFSNLINGLAATFENSELVKATTSGLATLLQGLASIVLNLGKYLIQSLDRAFKAVTTSIDHFKLGLLTITELSSQLAKGEMPSLEKAIQKISKLKLQPVLDAPTWKKLNDEVKKAPPIILNTAESLRKLKADAEKASPTIKELLDYLKSLPEQVQELDNAQKSGLISSEQLSIGLDELIDKGQKLGGTFEQVTDRMSEGFKESKGYLDQLLSGFKSGGFNGSSGGGAGGGFDFGSLFSNLFDTGLDAVSGGSNKTKEEKITDLIVESEKIVASAIGAYYGGPIGAAIGYALGGFFGKIDAKITLFTLDTLGIIGESRASKERKKLREYFKDIFEANGISVVINGEFKKLKELIVAGKDFGNPAKGFFDEFDKLSTKAKEAFKGVGIAFAGIAGAALDIGSTFGAVFANSIGPNLNNLQLLVEQSGVSFENLEESIENAFLNGALAATDARLALIGIQKVAEKGIPDAVGAADTAFQNLIDAGLKGGRISVDALKDIVYEAKEVGITNFSELRKFIRDSGDFSSKEIKALFGALKDIGVSNFDQLTSASLSTIIAVLTQFNSRGGFDEATAKLEDTATAINNVPSEKKVKFIIDVDYTDRAKSVTAQAALANINAPTVKRAEGVR